jgi:EmrB/QacA subfamily drug resistance transporter
MPTSLSSRTLVTGGIMLAMFLAAMEATVVATAMPTIVADLGGLAHYGWVGSAYLLASTVTVPLYGKLADLYGRKPLMLLGLSLFGLGLILGGLAPTMGTLIAARVIQGAGAGAIQPISMTIIGDLYSIDERARVQGALGAVWGFAGVAGPLLGGFLVSALSWRWVFWINMPFVIASAIVLARVFHEPASADKKPSIDWGGAALITAGSIALLLGAGGEYATILLPSALVLLVAFIAVERRHPSPLLPLDLLMRRDVAVACGSSLIVGALMMGIVNYLPLYMQGVAQLPPASAGAAVTPMLIGWPISATLSARFMARVGFRAPILLGSTILAISVSGVAAATTLHAAPLWLGVAMFGMGTGMGMLTTATVIGLQTSVGWTQRGTVTAASMFSRSMGSTLGVGVIGALLTMGLSSRLDPERVRALLDPEARAHGAIDALALAALDSSFTPLFWGLATLGLLNLALVTLYPRAKVALDPALPIHVPID